MARAAWVGLGLWLHEASRWAFRKAGVRLRRVRRRARAEGV